MLKTYIFCKVPERVLFALDWHLLTRRRSGKSSLIFEDLSEQDFMFAQD